MKKKRTSGKKIQETVCCVDSIKIVKGVLTQTRGRTGKTQNLFELVGEKLSFEVFNEVKTYVLSKYSTVKGKKKIEGVYIAHDSDGTPIYIGRGSIFGRLSRHKSKFSELKYFSFFKVKEKGHEREIETLLIHVAAPLLKLNKQKMKIGTMAGRMVNFEAHTEFLLQKKVKIK